MESVVKDGVWENLSGMVEHRWGGVSITKRFTITAVLILGAVLVSGIQILEALAEESKAKNLVGSSSDDWWTTYSDESLTVGSEVTHPQWILSSLERRPVLIYVHKGCSYCRPQTEAMAEVVKEYGDKLAYYDIAADGSDNRAMEIVSTYDPNGGVSYVPLTIIASLAPGPDGKVHVVWHSAEEVTGKAWIEGYVQDAIAYHDDNSGNWKKSEAQRSVFNGHI